MIGRLVAWYRAHRGWNRFRRGLCWDCGKHYPLQGATMCRGCYEAMRDRIWNGVSR